MSNEFSFGKRVRIISHEKTEYVGKEGTIVKHKTDSIWSDRGPRAVEAGQMWWVLVDGTEDPELCFEKEIDLI